MKKKKNMQEQDKLHTQKKLNEMEIYNLSHKAFKVIFIKMLTKLGRRIHEHRTSKERWKT